MISSLLKSCWNKLVTLGSIWSNYFFIVYGLVVIMANFVVFVELTIFLAYLYIILFYADCFVTHTFTLILILQFLLTICILSLFLNDKDFITFIFVEQTLLWLLLIFQNCIGCIRLFLFFDTIIFNYQLWCTIFILIITP